MKVFQMYSRKNDVNGNPYRLMVVYDCSTGSPVEAFEERSSSPNQDNTLRDLMPELPQLSLTPSEYKSMKDSMKHYKVEIQHV